MLQVNTEVCIISFAVGFAIVTAHMYFGRFFGRIFRMIRPDEDCSSLHKEYIARALPSSFKMQYSHNISCKQYVPRLVAAVAPETVYNESKETVTELLLELQRRDPFI